MLSISEQLLWLNFIKCRWLGSQTAAAVKRICDVGFLIFFEGHRNPTTQRLAAFLRQYKPVKESEKWTDI